MSDDRIETDIARAKRAALLIDDELLREAFATLEADYTKYWKATDARDTDARERIWLAMQVIGKVQGHLNAVLLNGQIAQQDLDMLKAEKVAA